MLTFFLKRKIKRLTKEFVRVRTFCEYKNVHRVVLLFDIENLSDVQAFVKTLEADGKYVHAFSFESMKKKDAQPLPENIHLWNKSHLDIYGIPQKEKTGAFCRCESDTVMDLTIHPHPVLQYLYLLTQADYRVGFNRENARLYDLLIECVPGQDFSFLSGQMHFYMKTLRTK
jgi:hypothetical protein